MAMDGMDDSLYGDDMPKGGSKPDSVDEQESMDPSALVDLKVLTGKHGPPKEGDEIVVKVVKIHGDQAEIAYAPEKPGGKEGEDHEGMGHDDMEELNSKY